MNRVMWLVLLLVPMVYIQAQVAESIQKGDAAYTAYDNEAALKCFQAAVGEDSANCEALWKLARAYVDVGELAADDIQESYYGKAETSARKAIAICPDNADAHLELAVAVGRVGLLSGPKKKVRLSKEVKTEAEKALELDPNHDIAHHVLARWNREVTHLGGISKAIVKIVYGGLPPASDEKAVEHFKKAIEIDPEYINHHLELGITYQMMDKWQEAKAEFEMIAQLPQKDSQDPDHKVEAERRLLEVSKKIK